MSEKLLLIISLVICLSTPNVLGLGCKKEGDQVRAPAPTTTKPEAKQAEQKPARCGACLSQEQDPVCTKSGTLRNYCYAICLGEKPLCERACPCPARK